MKYPWKFKNISRREISPEQGLNIILGGDAVYSLPWPTPHGKIRIETLHWNRRTLRRNSVSPAPFYIHWKRSQPAFVLQKTQRLFFGSLHRAERNDILLIRLIVDPFKFFAVNFSDSRLYTKFMLLQDLHGKIASCFCVSAQNFGTARRSIYSFHSWFFS